MNIVIKEPQQAFARQIEFADQEGEAPVIREPRSAWLQVHDLDALALLRDAIVPKNTSNELTFVFLPSGAATPYEVQKQAESWMASRPGEDSSILEVHFRSERLLWRPGRAICFGSPQASEDVFTGVSRFSFCESELTTLERQVQDSWITLDRDIELMKRLSSRNLKRQRHIDAMARTATMMRMGYVRLQAALERPRSDLAGPARRLFLELALQADTVDRLRMLDDAIEVFEEFYKHVREQFSEFRYFTKEYRVEFLILLVLLGDVLVSIEKWGPWISSITQYYQSLIAPLLEHF